MIRLRATKILNDGRTLLIAVESVDVQYGNTNTYCQMSGTIKPIAVVTCNHKGVYAFDMDAKPTDVDHLRQCVPQLDVLIATFEK